MFHRARDVECIEREKLIAITTELPDVGITTASDDALAPVQELVIRLVLADDQIPIRVIPPVSVYVMHFRFWREVLP
jgi:hypothetical protein